jgi:hypothetical protein
MRRPRERERDDQWSPAEGYRGAHERGRTGYPARPPEDRETTGGWYGGDLPGDEVGRSMERGFSMMDIDHRGHGPEGYQRTDERVHGDVCDRLTDDRHVDARKIAVQVAGGVVTLTGQVTERSMKWRAEELAERVSGAKEVDNQIRVRRESGGEPPADGGKRKGGASA